MLSACSPDAANFCHNISNSVMLVVDVTPEGNQTASYCGLIMPGHCNFLPSAVWRRTEYELQLEKKCFRTKHGDSHHHSLRLFIMLAIFMSNFSRTKFCIHTLNVFGNIKLRRVELARHVSEWQTLRHKIFQSENLKEKWLGADNRISFKCFFGRITWRHRLDSVGSKKIQVVGYWESANGRQKLYKTEMSWPAERLWSVDDTNCTTEWYRSITCTHMWRMRWEGPVAGSYGYGHFTQNRDLGRITWFCGLKCKGNARNDLDESKVRGSCDDGDDSKGSTRLICWATISFLRTIVFREFS